MFLRRSVRSNVLTPRHLAECLQLCQVEMDMCQLEDLFYSQISLIFSCRVLNVYRRREERYAPNCVPQVSRFGGGSVTAWARIGPATRIRRGRMAVVHVQVRCWASHIDKQSCSVMSTVEYFSSTIPDHMLHVLVTSFCSATTLHWCARSPD